MLSSVSGLAQVPGLTELHLDENRFEEVSEAALAGLPALAQLRVLSMRNNPVQRVAQPELLSRVQTLLLDKRALVASPRLGRTPPRNAALLLPPRRVEPRAAERLEGAVSSHDFEVQRARLEGNGEKLRALNAGAAFEGHEEGDLQAVFEYMGGAEERNLDVLDRDETEQAPETQRQEARSLECAGAKEPFCAPAASKKPLLAAKAQNAGCSPRSSLPRQALASARSDLATSPFVEVLLPTGMGPHRDDVVASAEIVVAIGGGAGTLHEVSAAWLLQRPGSATRPK